MRDAVDHFCDRCCVVEIAGRGERAAAQLGGESVERVARACHESDTTTFANQRAGYRRTDSSRRARDQRRTAGKRLCQSDDPFEMSRRNSSRVFGSSRNDPRTADVTVLEFCF